MIIDEKLAIRALSNTYRGWSITHAPVDAEVLSALLDVISEFPFAYDIKCADGRTLSGG